MRSFIILMLLSFSAFAFSPKDLLDARIIETAPCLGRTCAIVEKHGKKYLILGVVQEDALIPIAIYTIEEGKLREVWNITWKEI